MKIRLEQLKREDIGPCKKEYKRALNIWGKDTEISAIDFLDNGFSIIDVLFINFHFPGFVEYDRKKVAIDLFKQYFDVFPHPIINILVDRLEGNESVVNLQKEFKSLYNLFDSNKDVQSVVCAAGWLCEDEIGDDAVYKIADIGIKILGEEIKEKQNKIFKSAIFYGDREAYESRET